MLMRYTNTQEVEVGTAVSGSDEVLYGDFSAGMISVPATSDITTLTFHVAPDAGGTYLALTDSSAAAVTLTVAASKAYPIPLEVAGAKAFKMTGNNAGSVTVNKKS